MCGFLYSHSTDSSSFREALELMRHRGPDSGGFSEISGGLIGHRRLSIIDLGEQSNQPFYSGDGRHVLIYNGEIYNFRELARKHHLECRTQSDTEVLLLLYLKLGEKCLTELNGMFAFVVLDLREKKVFAARDRLGIKPLYIDKRNGGLAMSSELAPLLELNSDFKWDEEGLRQYVKLRTCFNGKTVYSGIEQLPAGCYFKDGIVNQYWSLPEGEQEPPEDDELRSLIEDAIRLRQLSDVPLGSYLSGGLDSSIIAGLAEIKDVWSVGFEGCNEFDFAQLAADKFEVEHHAFLVKAGQFQEVAKQMIKQRGAPLSVPNEVMIYLMTKQVKKKNTVVLSGEGADELFFGYDRIFQWAKEAENFDLAQFDSHYSYGSHKDDEILESVLNPHLSAGFSVLDTMARFFQTGHLQGLLQRLDHATMGASVEARVPFVDHRLVERMAGVGYDFRMYNNVVKAPLKRLFSDLVPAAIIERKKVGFPVPLETLPFYNQQSSGTLMDQWLKFNLRTLTGCDDLYQQITRSPSGF